MWYSHFKQTFDHQSEQYLRYIDNPKYRRALCQFRVSSHVLEVHLIHYSAFFGSEGHVALDRNPGPGYDTLFLRLIPGDLLSGCPHRQFHTLPVL